MKCEQTRNCNLVMQEALNKINTKCFHCNVVECPDCEAWLGMGYNEEYDSYFCKVCKNWLEDGCSDPKCTFCPCRPKTAQGLPDVFMERLE